MGELVKSLGLGALLGLGPACAIHMGTQAKSDGRAAMQCDDADVKMRFSGFEERRYIVYGCGQYTVYEGSCNGEANGCDKITNDSSCQDGCRIEPVESGELDEGEIPHDVLKPRDREPDNPDALGLL